MGRSLVKKAAPAKAADNRDAAAGNERGPERMALRSGMEERQHNQVMIVRPEPRSRPV